MGESLPEGGTRRNWPRSFADLAWQELRDEILSGKLAPGTPLLLKETAEQLGMSIMPVREAIRRLHHEGFLDQEPQRGATVSPVSLEDLEDLYDTRIALEVPAVRKACDHITREDYESLTKILNRFVDAYDAGNVREGRDLHREFHLGLYRVSGSRWLMKLIPPLLDHSERYRGLSLKNRGTLEDRRQEHQVFLDACMRGKKDEAGELLAAHLKETVRLVRRQIEQSGGTGGVL